MPRNFGAFFVTIISFQTIKTSRKLSLNEPQFLNGLKTRTTNYNTTRQ